MNISNNSNNNIYAVDESTGAIVDTISNEKHFDTDAGYVSVVKKRIENKKEKYKDGIIFIMFSSKLKVVFNDFNFGDYKDFRAPYQVAIISAEASGISAKDAISNLEKAGYLKKLEV